MVDHVKALGYKITAPKLFIAGFGTLILLWLLSLTFAELAFFQVFAFTTATLAFWLIAAGIWDLIIGVASIPDAKRGRSIAGGATIIGIGIINIVIALTFFVGGRDLLLEGGFLTFITIVVFGFTVLFWYANFIPEVVKRKSFVKALN